MAPTRWQTLGGLVYNADGLPGEAGRRLYDAGLRWIAVLGHQGSALYERNLLPDQLARVSAWRQAGIEVGAWGSWFEGAPDADAALKVRQLLGAPFYIGDPEAAYERSKGDYSRAAVFEARARQIGLKVDAITSYGRARREELDWSTLKRVAKVWLPQAYGGPDGYFDLKWCYDEAEPWWPAQTHPVFDTVTALGRPHGKYLEELADASQLGFKCLGVSVWLLERTSWDAIDALASSPWVAR
jgi:hypothetical protein